jgi:hypothetical protein
MNPDQVRLAIYEDVFRYNTKPLKNLATPAVEVLMGSLPTKFLVRHALDFADRIKAPPRVSEEIDMVWKHILYLRREFLSYRREFEEEEEDPVAARFFAAREWLFDMKKAEREMLGTIAYHMECKDSPALDKLWLAMAEVLMDENQRGGDFIIGPSYSRLDSIPMRRAIRDVLEADMTKLAELLRKLKLDKNGALQEANLTAFRFKEEQDLRGIDFSGADLRGTGIERALVDGTNLFIGAMLDQGAGAALSRKGAIVFADEIPEGPRKHIRTASNFSSSDNG